MFKNKNENIVYHCTICLLDDSEFLNVQFQPHHKGKFLLDYICDNYGIKEKDYFGFRYVDPSKQRHWLDLGKSIMKQIKEMDPIMFSFRVKFYPADPFRVFGSGRIMLYQQLKRDLRHGRLYCSTGEAAALGALIVQEELGDYEPDFHQDDYVSSLKLALRQTDALEKKIMDLHQKREPGQEPHLAMEEFMAIAKVLETYGIDPHSVKDHRGTQLYLGINHCGINTFISGKRSQHFKWSEVHKLNYEGKMFIVHLSYTDKESREPKKHTIGFKCMNGAACRYLWRCAIEQMLFFTLPSTQNAPVVSGGGFFSWGTKFKYTGRSEREILTESINALREQRLTNSATPKRASSVPATPSSPQGDLAQIRKLLRNSYISNGYHITYNSGYSSLPRSTLSEPLGGGIHDHMGHIYNPDGQMLLEPVTEEARLRASNIDNLNNPEFSEYYFRDSFEHSSTETLTNPYTINKHGLYGTNKQQIQAQLQHSSSVNNSNYQKKSSISKFIRKFKNRKFRLFQSFIISFILAILVAILLAIYIIESDNDTFENIRNLPEMITLKYQYYLPIKNYLKQKYEKKNFIN